jgi:sodium/potassium-transporting ATPase subunit alpha
LFAQSLLGNRLITAGVIAEILLILLIDYTAVGQAVFGTEAIGRAAWLYVVPFALAMLAEQLRKAVVRITERRAMGRGPAPLSRPRNCSSRV